MTSGGSDSAPPPAPRDAGPAGADPEAAAPRTEQGDEEMGGEAPCQLHRFWDADEE